MTLRLTKNGSEGELLVAFIGLGKDSFNLSTLQTHLGLHTQSYCLVRGVLFDQSQASVTGLIKIAKKAQYTNAFLEEKILLVGADARATAEPKLEIEANEVKASHAATVGKLDEEQIFYLQTRGMSHSKAQEVLVRGFLQPVIDRIKKPELRYSMKKEIENKLES